jgi:hypothetical protein
MLLLDKRWRLIILKSVACIQKILREMPCLCLAPQPFCLYRIRTVSCEVQVRSLVRVALLVQQDNLPV